jgi:uncharacterized protein (DUF2384 family)
LPYGGPGVTSNEVNLERPIRDLKTVLRLSRDLRPRGGAVCQMVSVAAAGICYREIVPAILTAPAVKTGHCDRTLALLAEHEAKAINSNSEAFRAEYFMLRSSLDDFQHRLSRPEAQQQRKDLIGGVVVDDREEELLRRISAMTGDEYAKEVDILNRLFGTSLALENQTTFQHLKGLPSLGQLSLDNTQVTDAGLEQLKGLPSLRHLSLRNTQVSDAGLEHLKGLPNLQWLFLRSTQVTDAGVLDLKKALPKLRVNR